MVYSDRIPPIVVGMMPKLVKKTLSGDYCHVGDWYSWRLPSQSLPWFTWKWHQLEKEMNWTLKPWCFLGWTFVKPWSLCNSFRQNLFLLWSKSSSFFRQNSHGWFFVPGPSTQAMQNVVTDKQNFISLLDLHRPRRYILGVDITWTSIIKERHWSLMLYQNGLW